MQVAKLIEEYKSKVAMCDEQLAEIKQYHQGRRDANDEDGKRYARASFHAADRLRQAYFQMVKDLEDISE